jgi:lysophospholipase L1-like esterase
LNKQKGIRTVLIQEAVFEPPGRNILENRHKKMKQLADQQVLPFLPLHDYLVQVSVRDPSVMWWDFVHLNSYGQKVISEWMAPQILQILLQEKPHDHKN